MKDKPQGRGLLVLAGVVSGGLWLVPMLRWVLWPLTLFNTYIHELSHAVATILTLGHVDSIVVRADGSGVTHSYGGIGLVIASAGYVGSALVGGGVVALSRTPAMATRVCNALAVVIGVSLVLVVRGDWVGWPVGLLWTLALAAGGRWFSPQGVVFFARFMGFQLALTSLHALSDLLLLSQSSEAVTDARIVESMVGVPAIVTAVFWALTAVACLGIALRTAWKNEPDPV